MSGTHNPRAPRRLKTYSAENGYVFEYVFIAEPSPGGYTFEISWDRKAFRSIAIRIDLSVLTKSAGRDLSTVERYAVAKLALRQAFDECESPESLPSSTVEPTREQIARILATLDLA